MLDINWDTKINPQKWTNAELIEQIDITERLIDLEYIGDSVFIDDIIELLEILKEECVRRIRVSASAD